MKRLFTIFSLLFITGAAEAQIPNASFENWTTVTATTSYNMLTGWDNSNVTTSAFGVVTCDSGMDSPPAGLAYLKLETKNTLIGDVPGVAVTGQIVVSGTSYTVKGGFPNTTRPANLTGKWKHAPSGSDHGRIGMFLWKWNTTLNKRDTIAYADTVLTGSSAAWASFSIPVKYFAGSSPDSVLIALSSSASTTSVTAGSILDVDDLAFSGTVPSGIVTVTTPNAMSSLFPNPASLTTTVYYHSSSVKEITINIADLGGRVIRSISPKAITGENNFVLDLKGIAQGIYFVQIVDEYGVSQKKLMVE